MCGVVMVAVCDAPPRMQAVGSSACLVCDGGRACDGVAVISSDPTAGSRKQRMTVCDGVMVAGRLSPAEPEAKHNRIISVSFRTRRYLKKACFYRWLYSLCALLLSSTFSYSSSRVWKV